MRDQVTRAAVKPSAAHSFVDTRPSEQNVDLEPSITVDINMKLFAIRVAFIKRRHFPTSAQSPISSGVCVCGEPYLRPGQRNNMSLRLEFIDFHRHEAKMHRLAANLDNPSTISRWQPCDWDILVFATF